MTKSSCDESFTYEPVADPSSFHRSLEESVASIVVVPQIVGDDEVVPSDTGDFLKWLRSTHPTMNVSVPEAKRLILRSHDLWFPLVYLATEVSLPIYLNLVSNYLYDRARGALRKEEPVVHLQIEHIDGRDGSVRRFTFDGNSEALRAVIKKIDVEHLFND